MPPPGLQPAALGTADPIGFVLYWTAIAACAGFVGSSEIIYNYVVHDDGSRRRKTRKVVGQFLPSLVGGASITVCFTHLSAALVPLLPGLWAICFGIGIFASRPYLPRASGWIALFYYAAGFTLLWIARGPEPLTGWWVGGMFGVGQLLGALVLWWNLERTDGRCESRERSRSSSDWRRRHGRIHAIEPGRFAYEGLDRVLHEKARLGIMTSLVTRPEGRCSTS